MAGSRSTASEPVATKMPRESKHRFGGRSRTLPRKGDIREGEADVWRSHWDVMRQLRVQRKLP
jgi:hypothetical protein